MTTTLTPSPDIQKIHVDLLRLDEKNIRKKADPDRLLEMAESLKEQGLIQNLECGPDGTLVFGNRRLRALKEIVIPELEKAIKISRESMAELGPEADEDLVLAEGRMLTNLEERLERHSHPAVRVLDEVEMAHAKIRQVIENLQREDVSAVDEAEGYAALLEERDEAGEPVYTPESIARKIGKHGGGYVRERLKIRNAPKAMLDALEAGVVGLKHCLLVGRIPNRMLRDQAAKSILTPQYSDQPLTVRETVELIREEYMVALRGAPFDPEDAALVPKAGVCSACPHRSGNDPDLEGALQSPIGPGGKASMEGSGRGISPDLCTNPACFRKKSDAAWVGVVYEAEAEGKRVLAAEEAVAEFNQHGPGLMYNSKYVDLADKPSYADDGHYDDAKKKTWGKLLKGAEVRVVLARHPGTGRVHELVERPVAKEAVELLASGSGAESPFSAGSKEAEEARLARAEERRAAAVRFEVAVNVVDALTDEVGTRIGPEPDYEGRALLKKTLVKLLEVTLQGSADAAYFMGKWLELTPAAGGSGSGRDYIPPIMELVDERSPDYSVSDLVALVMVAAVAQGVKYQGAESEDLRAFCEIYGVDVEALAAEVEKSALASAAKEAGEKPPKKKAAKKKAAKKKAAKKKAAKKKAAAKKKGGA